MFQLFLLIAAISALELPSSGRFLVIEDTPDSYMVLDAASMERQGANPTVRIVNAFSTPMMWQGQPVRIVQFVQEFDCRGNRQRRIAAASFTEELEIVQDRAEVTAWTAPTPHSPGALAFGHACRGTPLPMAGEDLMTVLRSYWSR